MPYMYDKSGLWLHESYGLVLPYFITRYSSKLYYITNLQLNSQCFMIRKMLIASVLCSLYFWNCHCVPDVLLVFFGIVTCFVIYVRDKI